MKASRKQRTFWILFVAGAPDDYRFRVFATKAKARAYARETGNPPGYYRLSGPHLVLEPTL